MLGKLIGKGNTAEVFDIGNKKVVKLFKTGYPIDSVHKEFKNSRLINNIDHCIIKSYQMIKCNGRYGIIYDKIEGTSMLDLLISTQAIEKYAKTLAALHKKILSYKKVSAVSIKSIFKKNIERTDKLSSKSKIELIKILRELPEDNCLCHGDFHFGNVMENKDKYYIIDYMNVCKGHKYGDIARTVYLIDMTPVPTETDDKDHFLNIKKQVSNIYLEEMGVGRELLSDWLLIIAAARLSELSDWQLDEINTILEFLSNYE